MNKMVWIGTVLLMYVVVLLELVACETLPVGKSEDEWKCEVESSGSEYRIIGIGRGYTHERAQWAAVDDYCNQVRSKAERYPDADRVCSFENPQRPMDRVSGLTSTRTRGSSSMTCSPPGH